MGLREFVDKRGNEWRAWDVTPEGMQPATVRELFLGEFEEGWLAFECAAERRRLARWPRDWESKSDAELEELLEKAAKVARRGASESASGAFRRLAESDALLDETRSAEAAAAKPAAEDPVLAEDPSKSEAPVRTFKGAGGRHWLASQVELTDRRGTRTVLRFTSTDGVVLDLDDWPDDWARQSAEQLIALSRRARKPEIDLPVSADQPSDERPR